MTILLLGGNHPNHKAWLRQCAAALEQAGHTVALHDYDHWRTGAPDTDIELELERLRATTRRLTDYTIMAKSVGTVIAARGVAQGILRPTQCLFLGVPLDGVAGQTPGFAAELGMLPSVTIVQNQFDPFGSAEVIKAFTAQMPNIRLLSVPDVATHDYHDFGFYASLLTPTTP